MPNRHCVIVLDATLNTIVERVVFSTKAEADAFAAQAGSKERRPLVFPMIDDATEGPETGK
jgi:hypothetical protein